mgnify:FL=1
MDNYCEMASEDLEPEVIFEDSDLLSKTIDDLTEGVQMPYSERREFSGYKDDVQSSTSSSDLYYSYPIIFLPLEEIKELLPLITRREKELAMVLRFIRN